MVIWTREVSRWRDEEKAQKIKKERKILLWPLIYFRDKAYTRFLRNTCSNTAPSDKVGKGRRNKTRARG